MGFMKALTDSIFIVSKGFERVDGPLRFYLVMVSGVGGRPS